MYILEFDKWCINESSSKRNWASFSDLPSDIQDALSTIKDHVGNIVLKEPVTMRKRIFNLQVYVKDREHSATFLFDLLKKENRNPKVISISTSGFTRHIEFKEGIYTIRLILRPTRGGMGMTTLNAAITELVPVLLYNSRNKHVSNNTNEMLEVARGVLNGPASGVLPRDKSRALHYFDMFEDSPLFEEKMKNAYALYRWLLEHDKESDYNKIDIVYWVQREKLPGVPPKTPADIIIKYKRKINGEPVLLGVSLKAGSSNSREPRLNTYVMNCLSDIAPEIERPMQIELWNRIYSGIVDLYNTETGENIELTDSTYWEYNNRRIDIEPIQRVLKWYLDNHESEFVNKYEEARLIIRKYTIEAINKSITNKNKVTFNEWLHDKMLLGDTFPIMTLKLVGETVEVLEDKGDNTLAKILKTEKLTAEASPNNAGIIVKSSNGHILRFVVRTSKPGYNKMLGQFYNLRLAYNGLD